VPRYMLLLGGADLDKRSANTELAQTMLEQYSLWVQSLAQGGRLRETYKLDDRVGARLSVRGGEVLEGPFIETKDAIGGIFVIEADSLEEATSLARQSPVLHLQKGYVEVRPVER
jgi:hypothetical protein